MATGRAQQLVPGWKKARSINRALRFRRLGRDRRLNSCEGSLQSRFFRVVERSLQHCAAFTFETFKDFVCSYLTHQHKECGSSGLNGGGGFLHPFVIETDVREI